MKIFLFLALLFSTIIASDKIKTFSSNFSQTIINPSGNSVKYSGQIHMQSSDKIAWFYTKPMIKNIYIVDKDVTIIEPELEQAIKTKHNMQVDLPSLVTKAYLNKKDFTQIIDKQSYTIIVSKDGLIKEINYIDEFENNVNITFYNTKYNQSIHDDLFEFYIPFDFDIIHK